MEHEALERLESACVKGASLSGYLYVYRGISRTVPPISDVQSPLKLCRSLCLLFQDECCLFQEVYEHQYALVSAIRALIEVRPCVRKSQVCLVLAKSLAVLHVLDVVKDNKPCVAEDCQLYEAALQRVLESTDEANAGALADFRSRLHSCQTLKTFFTTPWSLLNVLLEALNNIPHAPGILAHASDFLCRTLQGPLDAFSPYQLPHQRYTLLQALPIVLYLHCLLNKTASLEDNIAQRQLEACYRLLGKHPVVPCIGDLPLVLAKPLGKLPLSKERFKKMMLAPGKVADKKLNSELERSFSLKLVLGQAQQVHNYICEGLVHFVREVKRLDQDGPVPLRVCDTALELAQKLLGHLSSWHCKILNLQSWRIASADHDAVLGKSNNFKDGDLPFVLGILSCLRGMVLLFRKSWPMILPQLQEKSRRVCKRFLESFLKRVEGICEVRIQKMVEILLQMSKSKYLVGFCEVPSDFGADRESDFNPRQVASLNRIKCVVEDIIDEALQPKLRLGGLRRKSQGGLSGSAVKDCRDFLKELYMLEMVLRAPDHLQRISDLQDLCFYESCFDVAGSVGRPKDGGNPLRLADSASRFPFGPCMDTILSALSLYEDASVAALHGFKVQHLYYEIREDALLALSRTVDALVSKIMSDFKLHVCRNLLRSKIKTEYMGSYSGSHRSYDSCFGMLMLRIAGCQVDFASVLINRTNEVFKSCIKEALNKMSDGEGPMVLQEVEQYIQVLRHTHSLLVRYIPLAPWSEIWKLEAGDAVFELLTQSIQAGLFKNFHYFTFLNEFHALECKSCPIAPPSIGHTLMTSTRSFGLVHLQSASRLLDCCGLSDLVSNVLEWIEHQMYFAPFLELGNQLDRLRDGALKGDGASFEGLLSTMLEAVEPTVKFEDMLSLIKRLESLGNALAFLRLLDAIEDMESGPVLEEVEEWMEPSSTAAGLSGTQPNGMGCMARGIEKIRQQLTKWEDDPKSAQAMHSSLSALFMWGAHICENEAYGSIIIGDGFLWSLQLLVKLLGQDALWESFSWAMMLKHVPSLRRLSARHGALDVRRLQLCIKQWLVVWSNVGLMFRNVRACVHSESFEQFEKDPDLVGFFGDPGGMGVSKLPHAPARRNPVLRNITSTLPPQLDRIYSSSPWASKSFIERFRPASAEGERQRTAASSVFSNPRFTMRRSTDRDSLADPRLVSPMMPQSSRRMLLAKENNKMGSM